MIEFLKKITIRRYWVLQIINANNHYLKTSGWTKSFKLKKSVNGKGEPIPWFTLPTVDFLNTRLNKETTILEYGSGNSTLYLCDRCNQVTTIEDNKEWYDYVKNNLPDNGQIVNSNMADYPRQIKILNLKPDIVIVDGKIREECIAQLISHSHRPSIIILDDSERPDYNISIERLKSKGYKALDFWGMAPGLSYKKCTTVFYQKQNCLDI